MLLLQARQQVAHYGRELIRRGLTTGSFGNLSVYVPEAKVIVISPSGMDYDKIDPQDVSVVTMDGVVLDGTRKPSSELDLHRIFYQNNPDVGAVVHTHSTYATLMACLAQPLEPIHYLIAYAGAMEVPCIPYHPFGTLELAKAALEGMGDGRALLLGGHGLVCTGPNLAFAMDAAEQLEFLAQLCYRARLAGGGVKLTKEQLEGAFKAVASYHQPEERKS